jgi:hypothetical protein
MSSKPVDDWTLVREKFEALVRERSDNIDDLLDAQFCNRFSQLITHAAARGQLRGRSENGGAPAGTRAKDPLDDSNPAFRGTVYALVIITVFSSTALAVGVVVGIN